MTPSTLHPLLASRFSPRAFSDAAVGIEDQRALMEAARWASSCFNEQPWSFILGDRHQHPEDFARILDLLAPANQVWAAAAPLLVVTAAWRNFSRTGAENMHAWHDLGLAVGQLTVEASARGLVLHQMAGLDRLRAARTLGLPEGVEVATAIAIGHPGDPEQLPEALRSREKAPRVRKALSEIAFAGLFGQAL